MSIHVIEELAVHMHVKLREERGRDHDLDVSTVSHVHHAAAKTVELEKVGKELKRLKIDAREDRMAIEKYQRKERKYAAWETKLTFQLEALKSDVATAESKTIDYEQKWEKSSARVMELTSTIQKLREGDLEKASEAEGFVKRIEHLLEEARLNKVKGDENIKGLNEQLKSMRETAAKQQQLVADQRDQLEHLQGVARGSQTVIARSEEAIEKMKEERVQATARETAFEEEITRLKGEVERARILVTKTEEGVVSDGVVKKAEASQAASEKRCAELAEEVNRAKEESIEHAQARDRAETMCKELSVELEVEAERAKNERKELSHAVEEAQASLLTDEKRCKELVENAKKERVELSQVIQRVESQNKELHKTVQELTGERDKLQQAEEKAQARNKQLSDKLLKLEEEKDLLEIKEAGGRAKIIDAEGKVSDLTRQVQLFAKKTKASDIKGHNEEVQIDKLKEEITLVAELGEKFKEEAKEKDVALRELKREVETLKKDLADKEKDEELAVSAFEEELFAIEQGKEAAEKELTALKQKFLDLQLSTAAAAGAKELSTPTLSVGTGRGSPMSYATPPSEDETDVRESLLVKASVSLEPFVNGKPAEDDEADYNSDDMEFTEM